ncbi:LON peptidase substrate-binding domain-containing protein [Thalassobius sp. Cn5-15]|uniref:LON peptidase substrate-binding domain-containing protein n=1 Tax=Thalassobius sp. Cn5-15 TaxID=2917763 RepID=UPI001EF3214E|nr:LON peptidase substrate-binding domain-containing protein [Thalassobius sp. Cn5-15]MCG7495142.1 LON peptidase substrate-binding domain-containing protein [Thalassobius sp. Cn5-15]
MTPKTTLPNTLPVFPLPGALLLPRARLPLHIFEPRYVAMLEACLASPTRLIGMVQPCQQRPADNTGMTPPRLHQIGCAGRITQFSETEDGRYMITLSGVSRFRVREELRCDTPYRQAQVCWDSFAKDQGPEEHDSRFNRPDFLTLLERYLVQMGLDTDWGSLDQADDELLINSLAMILDFAPEDKQALLEAPSLSTRRETLVTLIEFALRGGQDEEILQ